MDHENEIYKVNLLLRKIRESQDIKQTDISKRTGLSKQMISKMEHREGNPTLSTFMKYCECINVDLGKAIAEYYDNHIK